MHVIRKFTAAMMAVLLLLVTAMPTMSAAACAMPGMDNATENMQVEPATPIIDWQDCYIECSCRINNHIDGMPHQLAPHALSMDSYHVASAINQAITMAEPAFTSEPMPFPAPPPRST